MNNESFATNKKLLRKREVAEIVSCSLRTIERLVQDGKLKPVKIRGAVRFPESQVTQLISTGVVS